MAGRSLPALPPVVDNPVCTPAIDIGLLNGEFSQVNGLRASLLCGRPSGI
jgi:hypothetical protein